MAQRSGYIGRHPGDGNSAIVRQTYSLTSETTELSFSAGYIVGYVDVYLNGVKLIDTEDYEATNASTITLTTAAPSGDVIEVVAYKALSVGSVQKANNDFEVTNNTTLGGTVSVAGTSTLTGVVTTGGDLYVGGDLYGDGSNLSGVGNTEYIDAGSVTSSGIVTISNTTASTSTTTGALVISGGVGIAGSMFVGENVSIAGTLTYEDVTNIDSVGVVTAQLGVIATAGRGVQVTAGGLNVTAGIATFKNEVDADGGIDVAGGVKVGAALTVVGALDVDGVSTVDAITVAETATLSGGVTVGGGVTMSTAGITTFSKPVYFNDGLLEQCVIVANKLSAATNIDLEAGNVWYFSTNETATATPNIRWNGSVALDDRMKVGETVSVSIISKPNGAGYYAALNVDGSGVTEEWLGGSAPSSANSGGYDITTHQLIKTATETFICLSNVSNYA